MNYGDQRGHDGIIPRGRYGLMGGIPFIFSITEVNILLIIRLKYGDTQKCYGFLQGGIQRPKKRIYLIFTD